MVLAPLSGHIRGSISAMAQAVNNIAATFASCNIASKSAASPSSSTATPASFSLPMTASLSGAAQSPSVSWNPQAKLPRSLKSSFVGLYGGPGPKPMPINQTKRGGSFRGFTRPRSTLRPINAAISVGDRLPDVTLSYIGDGGNLQTITVSDLAKGKKVVLLGVPGAFTPTCSQKHLPGFVQRAGELKSKGVETIACISVNDAFVMKAWGESLNVGDKVLLLADGNGHFTKAMGVTVDFSDKPAGLGIRSRRYALLAEDGVVKVLNLEEGGAFTVSGAEHILKVL